jgi:hypothetical protein
MRFPELPFPRGKTGATLVKFGTTLTSTFRDDLVGQTFPVEDKIHGTNRTLRLRIVRNVSGGALTVANLANRFLAYRLTTAGDLGRNVTGLTGTIGMQGRPIDDYYNEETALTSIAANDLFYVVDEGPCYATTAAADASLTHGEPVTCDALGALYKTKAVEGHHEMGQYIGATTTTEDQKVVIDVKPLTGVLDNITGAQAAAVTPTATDPTLDASDITDNSGGVDPGDQTIAAITEATGVTITYTANDPSITPDGAVTVADGSTPTVNELLELAEEGLAQSSTNATAIDSCSDAIALIAAEYNNLKDDTEANETAIEALIVDVAAIISALQASGQMAT